MFAVGLLQEEGEKTKKKRMRAAAAAKVSRARTELPLEFNAAIECSIRLRLGALPLSLSLSLSLSLRSGCRESRGALGLGGLAGMGCEGVFVILNPSWSGQERQVQLKLMNPIRPEPRRIWCV